MNSPGLPRKPVLWLVGFGVWTLLALLVALQSGLFLGSIGQPFEWTPLILGRLADWYTCAIFTPLYFWLVRRYPVDRQHWPKRLPVYLAITCVSVVLKYAMYQPLLRLIPDGRPIPGGYLQTLGVLLQRNFAIESIAFWCLLGVVHAIVFYERYKERESQTAELRARLAAAQLDALAGQLHPHFLFNTLQGVSTLMHRDPQAADRMLTQLSELLRRTLQQRDRQEVELREELETLGHYVGIMQVRFGDRLTFRTEAEPGIESALVPHFVLQPLVENALHHGIARRAGAGLVVVRAERAGDRLRLLVRDDGPGLANPEGNGPAQGIGLSNTRLRMQQLYGDQQQVVLEQQPGGGVLVCLELPFRPASAGASGTPS
ncbi:MAG TPA: histidine kinase [Gemmatimonadales bacterium]|jgi:signal transduction histidine kinase|nr:histidine kinase [Gemmatimonadales bacterium]